MNGVTIGASFWCKCQPLAPQDPPQSLLCLLMQLSINLATTYTKACVASRIIQGQDGIPTPYTRILSVLEMQLRIKKTLWWQEEYHSRHQMTVSLLRRLQMRHVIMQPCGKRYRKSLRRNVLATRQKQRIWQLRVHHFRLRRYRGKKWPMRPR